MKWTRREAGIYARGEWELECVERDVWEARHQGALIRRFRRKKLAQQAIDDGTLAIQVERSPIEPAPAPPVAPSRARPPSPPDEWAPGLLREIGRLAASVDYLSAAVASLANQLNMDRLDRKEQ